MCLSVFASSELPNPHLDDELIYQSWGPGDYLQFAPYIDRESIRLVFEIGSRDALDAIFLGYHYHCPVFAFECNPEAIDICQKNVEKYPFVTIAPYACWNETKTVPFYPVVESDGSLSNPINIGASSLLVAREDGCDKQHKQGFPIQVQAVRLDDWMKDAGIEVVDLICMDCQGATLQVLEGLGTYLDEVKYIITEVYLKPSFEEEFLYPEINAFLSSHGFTPYNEPSGNFCDVLFINKRNTLPKK
jgi:FkbM family methyltransferase